MKEIEIFIKISEFLAVDYKGFYLVDKQGKKKSWRLAKNLNLVENSNGLTLQGQLAGHNFNILFTNENTISMQIDGAKDIRRAVPFVTHVSVNSDSRILVQDFFNCCIKNVVPKVKGKSEFHISIGVESDENALSLINVIPSKFYSAFVFKEKNGVLEVGFATDFPYSYTGEYKTETACIYTGENAVKAIEKSTENIVEENFERPIGWSTWDYYFRDVSDECIEENVEFISNDKELKEQIKYIAIDDGWHQTDGDWFEGNRIKKGLKATVDYIHGKGYKAGIWTAPVRVEMLSGSAMRRIYPALVKNSFGDPLVYDAMYVLDPTHPIGESFVRDIYLNLAKNKFDFYKIDFLDYLVHSDYFYDENAGHYDVLRKLLSIIRECVGKDAHLMGCNMPYGVGKGYVQSRRVGLDIHNHWGHIKKCTEFYLPQFASHNKLYFNDIDYLVVRGADTGDDSEPNNVTNPNYFYVKQINPKHFVWRYGEDFDFNEAKFWATMVLMSGSSIFLGDRLSRLNQKGLNLIKNTIKNADFISATPLDILKTPLPDVWYKNNQLFVFNWLDEAQTITVDLGKVGLNNTNQFNEIYTSEVFNATNGLLTVTLQAHCSLALKGV